MKSSAKRIICIGVVVVVAVCAALLAHFFPGNSADGSADIVRASVDENGMASFGCKSDNDYAGLVLNRKDKTFNFMQSYRFSAALSGTYEENDDYLILTAKNSGSQSKFTFKKQKDGLEFLAKKSDSVREFCYSADSEKTDKCLKNKALFAPESIRTDVITYIGKNEHDGQKDYVEIVLSPADGSYSMYRSGMSDCSTGTYEENDDYLILTAKNSGSQSKFTFKKQKDGLEFLAKKSDSVREFCYSADSEKTDKCLKNKALFAPESIRTDVITYIGKNEHDGQKDYVEIVLSPADGSYSMYRSGMSDCSTGTYEEKDNRLVLSDDNGRDKYYFSISGNEIALDSAKSAKTSYIYSDAVLEKLAGGQHPSDVLESYFKS